MKQLNIEEFGNTLEVRLRNFPQPVDVEQEDGYPVFYYDEEHTVKEPPVRKEEDEHQDIVRFFREDNDELCGFDIENWDEHRDINLLEFKDGQTLRLDPPRM